MHELPDHKDSQIASLTSQLAAAERRIATLEAVLDAQKADLERLIMKYRALGGEVGSLAGSLRATWPISTGLWPRV